MGKVRIVVGARSAIFAPLTNIGVIIIDEEHTATYKQENHPRYHARDIAILRSEYHNCPIVLGSATPSLESFARAMNKNYELLVMKKRANNMVLPDVHIVDMKEEIKRGNYTFSKLLIDKINEKITNAKKNADDLNSLGYVLYKRDVNNKMYLVENINQFYISSNCIYVIFAYGNDARTSEMDIVTIN